MSLISAGSISLDSTFKAEKEFLQRVLGDIMNARLRMDWTSLGGLTGFLQSQENEPEFLHFYGEQESISRKKFRQSM